MKKSLLWLVLSGLLWAAPLSAQDYTTVVGLRAGLPSGVNVKQLINGGVFGIEGIIGGDFNENLVMTGLFEYQGYISRNMNWFAGGGFSVLGNQDNLGWAFDAIGGVELTFDNYPLNVALDLKPSYKAVTRQFAWYEMGLSVRYIWR